MNLIYELEVIKKIITNLKITYPYLFKGNVDFYKELDELILKKPDSKCQILEIQSKLYEILESNEDDYRNWYSIYHSVHINVIRNSKYASKKFLNLLNKLLDTKNIKSKNLLIPACGKLFEIDYVINNFNAENIFAEDIDIDAIEFTRGIHKSSENLFLKHIDLSKKQETKQKFDIALFMHPQITDYDKLANSSLYKKYNNEFKIPYTAIKQQNKSQFMDKVWNKIIINCLDRLEDNGYGFFIFYEYRELDILLEWLNQFNCYRVVNFIYDDGLIDCSFAKNYLSSFYSNLKETAQYVVMGAYRAGLVVQKKQC